MEALYLSVLQLQVLGSKGSNFLSVVHCVPKTRPNTLFHECGEVVPLMMKLRTHYAFGDKKNFSLSVLFSAQCSASLGTVGTSCC